MAVVAAVQHVDDSTTATLPAAEPREAEEPPSADGGYEIEDAAVFAAGFAALLRPRTSATGERKAS
jgi:hypothetical protein